MADVDNTPEGVAYALFRNVLQAEGKLEGSTIKLTVTREELLNLYERCIRVVRSGRPGQDVPPKAMKGP